jgi:hypothetical protein
MGRSKRMLEELDADIRAHSHRGSHGGTEVRNSSPSQNTSCPIAIPVVGFFAT